LSAVIGIVIWNTLLNLTNARSLNVDSQMIARASSAVRARFFHSLADPGLLEILDALRGSELTG
jgi:hypothetical protein